MRLPNKVQLEKSYRYFPYHNLSWLNTLSCLNAAWEFSISHKVLGIAIWDITLMTKYSANKASITPDVCHNFRNDIGPTPGGCHDPEKCAPTPFCGMSERGNKGNRRRSVGGLTWGRRTVPTLILSLLFGLLGLIFTRRQF